MPAGAAATLEVEPEGAALNVVWSAGGPVQEVRLEPTGNADVLAVRRGGLMARLTGAQAPNPLAGDAVTWARLAPEALYLYSLRIETDGRFAVDRLEWRPRGETMELRVVRQSSEPGEQTLHAMLQRVQAP